jgi:hypothetical protein
VSTRDEIDNALREWARGHKPTMAAVDFLIMAEAVPSQYVHEIGRPAAGAPTHWLDLDALCDDLEAGRSDYLSGGEYATRALVLALYRGVLDDHFWRLDGTRKSAFVRALERNA